jgi:hypothetical protein
MIIAFLSRLMKFWIIDGGIGGGYCESVSRQIVSFALDCATGVAVVLHIVHRESSFLHSIVS